MTPVVLALPGNEVLAGSLATQLGAELGQSECRRFPDGESYVRIDTEVRDWDAILVCTLDRPDPKLLPLLLMAAAARDLRAAKVGLVCPYLPYMRQDKRFRPGEAVSSAYFATLLGGAVDWLVTVDPHLHRHSSLGEIFSIPASVVHASPLISAWIREHRNDAFLIGPDSESLQWIASVAEGAGVPYAVLHKVRRGDREVEISLADLAGQERRTPVLVDDIISTAGTMIAAVGALKKRGWAPPVCIGVHAVFAEGAHARLLAAGAAEIVTCDTIPHETNRIDLSGLIAGAVRSLVAPGPG